MTSYFVSSELSSFLGVSPAESIPRHEIEHKILSYVKEKNLVHRYNKMVYHTDDVLKQFMNGKEIFSGFAIIAYLINHLTEMREDSSQGDQMNSVGPEESCNESESNDETPEESCNESESNDEESNDEEENQEETVRRVVLRDPSGNEFVFETSNHDNVRIQRTFVMSNDEFRELADTIIQAPVITDKEEQPYEYCVFLIMFLTSLLSFSLWLSIFNNGMEKMTR